MGSHIWSFGPAAFWPVLDFGALDAQVDVARLQRRAYLLDYRRTILNAVQEVDTAVDGYAAQEDRLKNLGDGLVAAQRAGDLATARYNRGLTDYLNVVDAERQLYNFQLDYAQAQVAEGEQFVQLYRSLGGGWENYQSVPDIQRPLPAVIAAFRRAVTSSAPSAADSAEAARDVVLDELLLRVGEHEIRGSESLVHQNHFRGLVPRSTA